MQFSLLRDQHSRRKRLLQQQAKMELKKRRLLLGIDLRLLEEGDLFVVAELVKGLTAIPVDVIFVTDRTTERHKEALKGCASQHQFFPAASASRVYSGADAMLFTNTSDETGMRIKDAMEVGTIVIAPEQIEGLTQYDPIKEEGNAFLFFPKNPWAIFFAVTRVLENFRFPYDWESLMRNSAKIPLEEEQQEEMAENTD